MRKPNATTKRSNQPNGMVLREIVSAESELRITDNRRRWCFKLLLSCRHTVVRESIRPDGMAMCDFCTSRESKRAARRERARKKCRGCNQPRHEIDDAGLCEKCAASAAADVTGSQHDEDTRRALLEASASLAALDALVPHQPRFGPARLWR